MKKQLTTNQASLLIAVCFISTKFQRLPALLAEDFGRDSWIIFAFLVMIDFLVALIYINFLTKLKDKTLFELLEQYVGKVGKIIVCIMLIFLFLSKAVITYKGTHEFFANMLFDKLPWKYFSVLMVLLLLLMVFGGLNSLGRCCELYSFIIGFGIFATLLLGFVSVDLTNILPVLDCNIGEYAKDFLKYQPWLGDFMVIPLLFGNVKITKSPKLRMSLAYICTGIVTIIEILFFYGINEYLSVYQANELSAITQYSLIGLGIGRPDWFLVLFVFISKILACGFYVYTYTKCVSEIFNVDKNYIIELVSVVSIYFMEYFLLKNIDNAANYFRNVICYIMFAINCFILILLIVLMCIECNKNKIDAPEKQKIYYKRRCEIWWHL